MVKTWWIRRWYFLYISVFTILQNFRKTCHEKFSVLQTYLDPIQILTNRKRIAKRTISDYPRRDPILNTSLSIRIPFLYSHSFIRSIVHSYTSIIPRYSLPFIQTSCATNRFKHSNLKMLSLQGLPLE